MKRILIFVFGFLLIHAFKSAGAQSDPKADAILQESKKKFQSLSDISATLNYEHANPSLVNTVRKTGSVKIKGDKYQVKFQDQEFYSNGTYVWVVLTGEGEKEITITNFDSEEAMNPDRIFRIYEENTKSKYESAENGTDRISLFMLDKESDIWKVQLWVNSTTKLTQKAKMYARNGSTYTYDLSNIRMNTSVPDSEFVIDHMNLEKQGWYINDLR